VADEPLAQPEVAFLGRAAVDETRVRRLVRRHDTSSKSNSGPQRMWMPRTRRRARLASVRAATGERPTIGAMSSNGTPNRSCSTQASRSRGSQRVEHHEQRETERVGE
jgi:hypothetical protein